MEMSGSSRKRAKAALPPDTFNPPEIERKHHQVREAELEHVTPLGGETGEEVGKRPAGRSSEERFRGAQDEIERRLDRIGSFEEQITGLVGKIDEEKNTIRKLIGGT